jgi:hypothetical protein
MRFAMAMAPRIITRMIATGVSHARIFVWSAVAPVMNGDACAKAREGSPDAKAASIAALQ